MDKQNNILSDSELLELSEAAPMSEGGTLEELLEEAQQVAGAVKNTGVHLSALCPQARALFFMRGFYFLGILRGGEAYRATLLNEVPGADDLPEAPFALSEVCADLWVDELREDPGETLRAIYRAVGLENDR